MTSETDTLLHVSGLRKTYRTGKAELVAVDDLSFSVRLAARSASWESRAPARRPRPGC
ncbi:hypothetical protein ACFQ10_46005 [Streptomyces indonesiensis]